MNTEGQKEDRLSNYVKWLEAVNPAAMQVFIADDEDQFIEAVERLLDEAIVGLESGANLLASMNEPTLSWMLVRLLAAAGTNASTETHHNGHVDVLIEHPRKPTFSCIGECKLHNGYKYHLAGCQQLLDRYSSGRARRGFCLDFFQVAGMYKKLEKLRERFRTDKPLRQQGDPAKHAAIKGAFVSTHLHVTETPVEILHLGCNCYHLGAKLVGSADNEAEPAGVPTDRR